MRLVATFALLLFTLGSVGPVDAAGSQSGRRDACSTWLATGVQPNGLTRADCNFAADKPYGSILRGGDSNASQVWRQQADHETRFVLDTGSEPKQNPQ